MRVQNLDSLKAFIIGLLVGLCSSCCAESASNVEMFTMSNGRIVSTNELALVPSQFSRQIGKDVTGFHVVTSNQLLMLGVCLKQYLLQNIDIDRMSDSSYQLDDIIFGFDGYYLQLVPCVYGDDKVIFINAYKNECNESPSEDLVVVDGGGASYWTLSYYLESKTFDSLNINQEW